ncbi:hypothetical protein VHUM_00576 [Vanrija humicola]|uniref:Anaphase-promoting complex subunit 4 WD40 domain-containing protein n=1 Tax=Vanrija humicola TaxID=5417 RepID=A0A7D8V3Y5_VANHU|nr:hypothetical protein VHUM_00576 [Vanrija humicola]
MQTNDTGLIFQSSRQLAEASNRERKIVAAEGIGSPIKVSSKVLDLVVRNQDVWTAESGWQARRLDPNTGKTRMLYKGHKGPVTSLSLHQVQGDKPWLALFTGSWDKTIRVWDALSGDLVGVLEGHSDFVKSVTVLPTSPPLLLSTSSDKTFRLWNLSPLESRGLPTHRQTVKEHTRPVEAASYEVSSHKEPTERTVGVWTADSLGSIKQWTVKQIVPDSPAPLSFVRDMESHDTSVSQVVAVEDGLWSASMDNTAKLQGLSSQKLVHPSYVKSILPNPQALPYIITGCEDENIRLWDANNLDAKPKPLSIVEGHCGEVTALGVWIKDENGKKVVTIVSGSLDGTLRRWTIQELLNPPKLNYEPAKDTNDVGLTEEEERELAELMSDSD